MYLTYNNKSRASGWLIQLIHILKIQILFIFSVYMLGCSPVRVLHGCKVATTVPAFAYFHPTCSEVYFSILSVGGKKFFIRHTPPSRLLLVSPGQICFPLSCLND